MKRILRGAASTVAVAGVIVAPPVALATFVGWPLPRRMPDPSAVQQAIRIGIPDEVLVKGLALVLWIVWAQLALALLAEMVATIRGRPTRQLPLVPGMQQIAARLVSGMLMMVGALHPSSVAVATAQPLPPAPVVQVESISWEIEPMTYDPSPAVEVADDGTEAPTPRATVTVERHDSFWSIAERTLGDGLRWAEIRDLNVGRTMPDGHTISADSDLLRPGWVLVLPADAAPVPEPQLPPGPAAEVAVSPGDSLWTIAADRVEEDLGRRPSSLEVDRYWRTLIDANDDRLPDPNLVHVGQAVLVPPSPYAATRPPPPPPAPPPSQPPPPPSSPPPPRTPVEPEPEPRDDPVDDEGAAEDAAARPSAGDRGGGSEVPVAPIIVGGLTSAALAVGVARAIRAGRRRHSILHSRRTAAPTAEPDRGLHRQVIAQADEGSVEQLNAALHHLAVSIAGLGASCRPRVAQHSEDHLDVLLDRAHPHPPAGWTTSTDSGIWMLDPTIDLPTEDVSVAPLLVTLGQPDDDGQIYLDLEAEGLVTLVGDDEASENLARSMAMELLLRSTADAPEVFVVGDLLDPRIVEDFDRASHASDWAAVVTDVRVWVEQTHRAIDTNDWGNGFLGRGADPTHDVLAPLAVVATATPPPEVLEVLTTCRPSTVGVVVVGPVDAPATTIECHDGLVTISELGLTCAGQSLDAQAAADLARLVHEAAEPEVTLSDPDGATDLSDEQAHGQGDSEDDCTEPE